MNRLEKVDKYLSDLKRDVNWSGSVLITKDDNILYENNISVPSNSRYCIASITKTVTGISIMQLIQDQKLSLNSKVSEFLPQLTNIQDTTIYDLLTHTSGLPPIYNDERFQSCMKENKSVSELIQAFESVEIDHNTKGKFSYINFDYILLKEIIEKVSGVTYESYINTAILQPLKMNDTGCLSAHTHTEGLLPNFAIRDGVLKENPKIPYDTFAGAGHMYSTVKDLYTLTKALIDGKLLDHNHTSKSLQGHGKAYDDWKYTLINFTRQEADGSISHFHEGGMAGFRSAYLVSQQNALSIIILSNVNYADIEEITLDIHDMLK